LELVRLSAVVSGLAEPQLAEESDLGSLEAPALELGVDLYLQVSGLELVQAAQDS